MAWRDEDDFEKWLLENPDLDDEDDGEPPVQPAVTFEIFSDTGDGVDCEDCGYTPDSLSYFEYDDGGISLHISLGCTGGIYFDSTAPHEGAAEFALNKIEGMSTEFFEKGVLETIIARLKERAG